MQTADRKLSSGSVPLLESMKVVVVVVVVVQIQVCPDPNLAAQRQGLFPKRRMMMFAPIFVITRWFGQKWVFERRLEVVVLADQMLAD